MLNAKTTFAVKTEPDRSYPRLKKWMYTDSVFLFLDETHYVKLTNTPGYASTTKINRTDEWDRTGFVDFDGSITLSNK